MDLNLIPPEIFSTIVEGAVSLSALPIAISLIVMLFGGMGNNALTPPAQLSAELMNPVMPFLQHYIQINGA